MTRPVVYLNNAATSWPKPEAVAAALARAVSEPVGSPQRSTFSLGSRGSRGPAGFGAVSAGERLIFAARE
jgi:hypothetical protein